MRWKYSKTEIILLGLTVGVVISSLSFMNSKGFIANIHNPENSILYVNEFKSSGSNDNFVIESSFYLYSIFFFTIGIWPFSRKPLKITKTILFLSLWIIQLLGIIALIADGTSNVFKTILNDYNVGLLTWSLIITIIMPIYFVWTALYYGLRKVRSKGGESA